MKISDDPSPDVRRGVAPCHALVSMSAAAPIAGNDGPVPGHLTTHFEKVIEHVLLALHAQFAGFLELLSHGPASIFVPAMSC
jgi:predicted component of type VI protein secretion system